MLSRWWVKDSVAALAAWQAIGAADISDALLNRNLTGAYNLSPTGSYTWAQGTGIGWAANGSWLDTDIVPASHDVTILIRASNDVLMPIGGLPIFGNNDALNVRFFDPIGFGQPGIIVFFNHGAGGCYEDFTQDHVYAIAGTRCYVDGALVDTIVYNAWPFPNIQLAIARVDPPNMSQPVTGLTFKAAAFFDEAIPADDVLEFSNRMLALDGNSAPPTAPYYRCKTYLPAMSPQKGICCDVKGFPTSPTAGATEEYIPHRTMAAVTAHVGITGAETVLEGPIWYQGEYLGEDAIFAYDSDAASYNDSKINLVNPGTYNLTTGGVPVPDWNPNRWFFQEQSYSLNQAVFKTGYTRPELDYNWTVAVRARDMGCLYEPEEGAGSTTCFLNAGDWNILVGSAHFCNDGYREIVWQNFGDPNPAPFPEIPDLNSWHVYVMAGETLYIDGVPVGTCVADPQPYIVDGHHSPIFQIGGQWWQDTPNNAIGGSNEISKVIGIDRVLTYDEVRLLSSRMGAVLAEPVLTANQASVAITQIPATLTSDVPPTGWWLPTGISNADCLWAYKAFGADSYAASKINVSDPGAGELEETAVGPPNWAAGSGWSWPAGGASPLLAPSVTNSGSTITVVVYCQQTTVGVAVAGSIYKNLSEVQIAPCVFILPQPSPGGGSRFCNGGATYDNIAYAIGYMSSLGVAGNKAYIDGYDAGITLDAWSGSQTGKFGIGGPCTHHQYMADNLTSEITTVRTILGAVAYKVTLTADQMLELNNNFVAWGY